VSFNQDQKQQSRSS